MTVYEKNKRLRELLRRATFYGQEFANMAPLYVVVTGPHNSEEGKRAASNTLAHVECWNDLRREVIRELTRPGETTP